MWAHLNLPDLIQPHLRCCFMEGEIDPSWGLSGKLSVMHCEWNGPWLNPGWPWTLKWIGMWRKRHEPRQNGGQPAFLPSAISVLCRSECTLAQKWLWADSIIPQLWEEENMKRLQTKLIRRSRNILWALSIFLVSCHAYWNWSSCVCADLQQEHMH